MPIIISIIFVFLDSSIAFSVHSQNKTLAFSFFSLNAKFRNRTTMSTPEEAGVTANATASSYGGRGVGGKFRKKPFRRQATPYDRPPTAFRDNNTNSNGSGSWLTKLVVEPASKLISYGADRFFGSVFRRRLPPLPPPQPPGDMLILVSQSVWLVSFMGSIGQVCRFHVTFVLFQFSIWFRDGIWDVHINWTSNSGKCSKIGIELCTFLYLKL